MKKIDDFNKSIKAYENTKPAPANKLNSSLSIFDEVSNIGAYIRLGETDSLENVKDLLVNVKKFCEKNLSNMDSFISVSKDYIEPKLTDSSTMAVRLIWKERMWFDAGGHQGPQRFLNDIECTKVIYYANSLEDAKTFTASIDKNQFKSFKDYTFSIVPLKKGDN